MMKLDSIRRLSYIAKFGQLGEKIAAALFN